MPSNREIATAAFADWMDGTGYIAGIFADDMTWDIVGRSAASATYADKQAFVAGVLHPFGARFAAATPFRPVVIRGIYSDDSQGAVIVVWDGEGITTAQTSYRNTYAWIMTFRDGKVVAGTAFYDSIAFNELWERVAP